MQLKNQPDDLEYLAELGYEKMPLAEEDLLELKRKIRGNSFSYNSGSFFALVSLFTGAILGISVFFVVYDSPVIIDGARSIYALNEKPAPVQKQPEPILLDTVYKQEENFSKRSEPVLKEKAVATVAAADVIEAVPLQPVLMESMPVADLKEEKIRFIVNSPVFYIQDLKVTNYAMLYFRKNKFIRASGTTAEHANASEAGLSKQADADVAQIFLHEELEKALRFYNKGRFGQCLVSLDLINSYNPEDLNCSFYKAMCYFQLKQFSKAIPFYEACIQASNNAFLQESQYYKALSLKELGRSMEAKKMFQQIVEEGEFYADKAREQLK